MTVPSNVNLLSADPKFPKNLPVTTDQSINQGDLVYWDAANGTLKALTSSGNVANKFCGVSNDTTPINIYGEEKLASLGVTRKGAVSLQTTAGEFYADFQEVTVGADAQTITLVGPTEANRVGFVVTDPPLNPQGAASGTPVGEKLTGAAGVRARVWLEPKFPSKFV